MAGPPQSMPRHSQCLFKRSVLQLNDTRKRLSPSFSLTNLISIHGPISSPPRYLPISTAAPPSATESAGPSHDHIRHCAIHGSTVEHIPPCRRTSRSDACASSRPDHSSANTSKSFLRASSEDHLRKFPRLPECPAQYWLR